MMKKYIKNIVREILEDGDYMKRDDYATCKDCGVVLFKDKAYKVLEREVYPDIPIIPDLDWIHYYCDKHKKGYDRVEISNKRKYFKSNVEVDENGKIKKGKKCNCYDYPATWNGEGWQCRNCGKVDKRHNKEI